MNIPLYALFAKHCTLTEPSHISEFLS